jgi:predicted GIY-YIG superfamily endonuclease
MAHNGIVYLLHFERSYRHARHYIGFTQNLGQRLEELSPLSEVVFVTRS